MDWDQVRAKPQAAPLPTFPEARPWRAEKDTRYAEARLRDVPHGHELRFVVGGEGRDETLMHSTVYRPGERAELGTASQGVQYFSRFGWTLVSESAAQH